MADPALAQMIANALSDGLPHPGRPETGEGPRKIPLVAFRTAGLPAEMREHVNNTALAVGEAIVYLIETRDGSRVILDRAELDALRAADTGPADILTVMCRNCKQPVVHLGVTNGRATVTPSLLAGINPTCPHTMEATP